MTSKQADPFASLPAEEAWATTVALGSARNFMLDARRVGRTAMNLSLLVGLEDQGKLVDEAILISEASDKEALRPFEESIERDEVAAVAAVFAELGATILRAAAPILERAVAFGASEEMLLSEDPLEPAQGR